GWTYYANVIPQVINPVLCALALAALAYSVVRSEFRRENGLLIGWIVCWYVLHSLFDNKQPRFIVFAAPAVILMAVRFTNSVTKPSALAKWIGYAGLVAILASQCVSVASRNPAGYSGIDRIVARTLEEDSTGNIAYLGHYRQMFVPWIRVLDPARRI